MNTQAGKIVDELKKLRPVGAIDAAPATARQLPLMAELLVLLAEAQEESSKKLEGQTEILIKETKALRGLTWAIAILTAALLAFEFLK
jgi:hypothetical protein